MNFEKGKQKMTTNLTIQNIRPIGPATNVNSSGQSHPDSWSVLPLVNTGERE